MSIDPKRFASGLSIRAQLGMNPHPWPNVDMEFYNLTISDLFGNVFARPHLSLRDREVLTLATIITVGGTSDNLSGHFRSVRFIGLTDQEIKEIILQVMYVAGWPRGVSAAEIYDRVVKDDAATGSLKDSTPSLDAISQDFDTFFAHAAAELFGASFTARALSPRYQQMLSLCANITLGAAPDVLRALFDAAEKAGFDEESIREIIIQTMFYAGWPRGAAANKVYNLMRPGNTGA